MTHEPECDDFQNDNVDGTCICPRIKDAYNRGREDAADEILKAGYQRSLNLIQAVTIARGGEPG